MSSTEHAPEPTMDEILASIRKIIADDDQSAAQQSGEASAPDPAPASTPAPEAGGGGNAPSSLVNDIANALNQSPAQETDDDIFDLTREVPPETPAAGEPAAGDTPAQPEQDSFAARPEENPFAASERNDPLVQPPESASFATQQQEDPFAGRERHDPFAAQPAQEDPFATQAPEPITRTPGEAASPVPPAPGPGRETASPGEETPQPDFSREAADVLAGTPMQEAPLPDRASGFGTGQPAEEAFPADEQPGGADSVFERATDHGRADTLVSGSGEIADLDDFSPEPVSPTPSMEDIALGVAAEDSGAEADTARPEFASGEAGLDALAGVSNAAAMESAGGMSAAFESNAFGEQAGEEESLGAGAAFAAASAGAAAGTQTAEPSGETGAGAVSGGGKSLEESVQEMLRPMLRAWLDENMPRILENAVRRELKSDDDFK